MPTTKKLVNSIKSFLNINNNSSFSQVGLSSNPQISPVSDTVSVTASTVSTANSINMNNAMAAANQQNPFPQYTYTPTVTTGTTTGINPYIQVPSQYTTVTNLWTEYVDLNYCLKIPNKEDIFIPKIKFRETYNEKENCVERYMVFTSTIVNELSSLFSIGEKFDMIHILGPGENNKKKYEQTISDCYVSLVEITKDNNSSYEIITNPAEIVHISYKTKETLPKFEEWFKVMK